MNALQELDLNVNHSKFSSMGEVTTLSFNSTGYPTGGDPKETSLYLLKALAQEQAAPLGIIERAFNLVGGLFGLSAREPAPLQIRYSEGVQGQVGSAWYPPEKASLEITGPSGAIESLLIKMKEAKSAEIAAALEGVDTKIAAAKELDESKRAEIRKVMADEGRQGESRRVLAMKIASTAFEAPIFDQSSFSINGKEPSSLMGAEKGAILTENFKSLSNTFTNLKREANTYRYRPRNDQSAFDRQSTAVDEVDSLLTSLSDGKGNTTILSVTKAIAGISEILRAPSEDERINQGMRNTALAIDDTGTFKALLTEDVLNKLVDLRASLARKLEERLTELPDVKGRGSSQKDKPVVETSNELGRK